LVHVFLKVIEGYDVVVFLGCGGCQLLGKVWDQVDFFDYVDVDLDEKIEKLIKLR